MIRFTLRIIIVARIQTTHTSPIHPESFAAERRYREHAPLYEHAEFRLIVSFGQRSGVQTGPVGLVRFHFRFDGRGVGTVVALSSLGLVAFIINRWLTVAVAVEDSAAMTTTS